MNANPSIHDILKQYWGYDSFRPLQEDIIRSVMDGQDTLALLPTGGGKSICFQVPAMAMEGMCIVVSPLIALMKDQVAQLRKRGIAAVGIFSGMSKREIDIQLDNCAHGAVKFLYVSPERLKTEIMQERAKRMPVSLLAIDEAHCISQWGYDFRPPYLEIAAFRELLSATTPCIALTATATLEVRTDIEEKLGFREGHERFQKSFSRPNLSYSVTPTENKGKRLLEILSKVKGSAIVYCSSRKNTQHIADFLSRNGISSDYYHAGLSAKQRDQKQQKWIENHTRVIAATNAFGMGIDKPDVRLVVHYDMPETIEAYYQEAGRAGRDEKLAFATLLLEKDDTANLMYRIKASFPEVAELKRVYQSIANYLRLAIGSGEMASFDFNIEDLADTYNLPYLQTFHAIKHLEQQGFFQLNESIHSPSRFMFKASKSDLYAFQIAHANLDPLIKTLLRTYGGELFTEPTSIYEPTVAKNLKADIELVKKQLDLLDKRGIAGYFPSPTAPQLLMLRERYAADALPLDLEAYHNRKALKISKAQAMIDYLEHPLLCRTQLLLQYFAELTDERCGVCDHCLNEKKLLRGKQRETVLEEKLLAHIKQHQPLLPKHLMDAFSSFKSEQLLLALRELTEGNLIAYNGEGLFITK